MRWLARIMHRDFLSKTSWRFVLRFYLRFCSQVSRDLFQSVFLFFALVHGLLQRPALLLALNVCSAPSSPHTLNLWHFQVIDQLNVCLSVSSSIPQTYLILQVYAVVFKCHCLSIKMLAAQLLMLSMKSLLCFWSSIMLGISLVIGLLSYTVMLHCCMIASLYTCFFLVKQHGGNLTIPADRFLHEIAFKLWKAPKYGAWLIFLFLFLPLLFNSL